MLQEVILKIQTSIWLNKIIWHPSSDRCPWNLQSFAIVHLLRFIVTYWLNYTVNFVIKRKEANRKRRLQMKTEMVTEEKDFQICHGVERWQKRHLELNMKQVLVTSKNRWQGSIFWSVEFWTDLKRFFLSKLLLPSFAV